MIGHGGHIITADGEPMWPNHSSVLSEVVARAARRRARQEVRRTRQEVVR